MTASPIFDAKWPDEVVYLRVSIVVRQDEFYRSVLIEQLKSGGFYLLDRLGLLSFPLKGDSVDVELRGRAILRLDDEGDYYLSAELAKVTGKEPGPLPPNSVTFSRAIQFFEDSIAEGAEALSAVATCDFAFPKDRWRSAVALPVQLVGVLDNATGKPQIAGFEFEFTDADSLLRNARISWRPDSDKFLVKLICWSSIDPPESMLSRVLETAKNSVNLLAIRLPTIRPEASEA